MKTPGTVYAGITRYLALIAFIIVVSLPMECQQSAATTNPQSQVMAKTGYGNITVRVVADGGRPLPEAALNLSRSGLTGATPTRALTNDNGEYVFKDLRSGVYSITVQYNGYVLIDTINNTDPERKTVFITGDSLVYNMTKGGAITGRVTDQSGPMIGILVRAIRIRSADGTAASSVSSAQTDDRGIYRIFSLQAGTYLVDVTGKVPFNRPTINPNFSDLSTYYPANPRSTAKEIIVTAGNETPGIDIRFGVTTGPTVSGTITNPMWAPGTSVNLRLIQMEARDNTEQIFVRENAPGHSFQITGVNDGEYEIQALYTMPGGLTNRGISQRFKVKGKDVNGINVALTPTAIASGKLVFDDKDTTAQTGQCKGQPAPSILEILAATRQQDHGPAFRSTSPDENGDFRIMDLEPGRYLFSAILSNNDLFVSSVIDSGRRPSSKTLPDLTGLIALTSRERMQGLLIKVAPGSAGISGRIASAVESPIAADSVRIYLLPSEDRFINDAWRYYERSTGSDGKFSIRNVAPGKYWIVALPSPQKGDAVIPMGQLVFDNNFRATIRKQAQEKGTALDLTPCQKINDLSLKVN